MSASDNAQLLFDALALQPSYDDPNLAAQFPYVAVKHVGGAFHALDMELSKVIKAPPGQLVATIEDLAGIITGYHATRGAVTLAPEVPAPVADAPATSRRSRRSTVAPTDDTLPGTIAAPSHPEPIAPLPDSTVSAVVTMAQAIDARLDTMAEAIAALRVSTDRQFRELADLMLGLTQAVKLGISNGDQRLETIGNEVKQFMVSQQDQTIARIEALIPTVAIGATIPTPIAVTVPEVPAPAPIVTTPDLSIPSGPFIRKNTNTGITTLVIPVTDPACDMDHYLGVIDAIADQTGLALPEDLPTRLDHPEMGALMVLPIAHEFYTAMASSGFPTQAA